MKIMNIRFSLLWLHLLKKKKKEISDNEILFTVDLKSY